MMLAAVRRDVLSVSVYSNRLLCTSVSQR